MAKRSPEVKKQMYKDSLSHSSRDARKAKQGLIEKAGVKMPSSAAERGKLDLEDIKLGASKVTDEKIKKPSWAKEREQMLSAEELQSTESEEQKQLKKDIDTLFTGKGLPEDLPVIEGEEIVEGKEIEERLSPEEMKEQKQLKKDIDTLFTGEGLPEGPSEELPIIEGEEIVEGVEIPTEKNGQRPGIST